MSTYATANHGSRQERSSSIEIIGNYPYGNLSVRGMALALSERIERHRQEITESGSAEAELPDLLETPEAEAA